MYTIIYAPRLAKTGSFKIPKREIEKLAREGITQGKVHNMKKAITKKEGGLEQKEYVSILLDIKKQIEVSRNEAFASINLILNKRNWVIGKIISEKQAKHNWGSGFVEKLEQDIQNMYPGIEGFSRTNVFRMKAFFKAYQKNVTAVTQFESLPIMGIPWGHNVVLLIKIKNTEERLWYAQKSIDNGWSRSMLETWIKSDLYRREGRAIINFKMTLPTSESEVLAEMKIIQLHYLTSFLQINLCSGQSSL